VKQKDSALVELWFERACKAGVKPKVQHFNLVIQGMTKSFNMSGAKIWFERALNADVTPDRRTLNILAKAALINGGGSAEVESIFERFHGLGVEPSASTYSMLVETAAYFGYTAGVKWWLLQAVNAGFGYSLTLSGLSSRHVQRVVLPNMILVACDMNDIALAKYWFSQASKMRMKMNRQVSSAFIRSCAKAGDTEFANKCAEYSAKHNVTLEMSAFDALISLAGKEKDIVAAVNLLEKAKQKRNTLNVNSFNVLFELAAHKGDIVNAERWYAEVQAASSDVTVSPSACASLVQVATENRQLHAAEVWYKRSDETQLDSSTYGALVDLAAAQGEQAAAEQWFARASDAGVQHPASNYNSLVLISAANGDLNAAELWFFQAMEAGIQINATASSALMEAAARTGDLAAVQYWHAQMSKAGGEFEQVALKSILDIHVSSNIHSI